MNKKFTISTLIIIASLLMSSCCNNKKCDTATSVDNTQDAVTQQHLQEWQNNKYGMFIHWGLYSVPAGVWNGQKVPYYAEQIMNHARIPIADYEQIAASFDPKGWCADSVVKLAKDAGMKYIVFTSKHHDGFCMFDTETTDYNVVDATPFGRDVIAELAAACKKYGVKLGLYYSLPDWHYPLGIPRLQPDNSTNCTQHVNQVYSPLELITPELEDYIVAQLTELLTNYGEIETIWFDMGLLTPQQSKRFRNTVKSLQPECLVSGRVMNNQGDYLTLPDNGNVAGYKGIAWDNPASMYGTWGYRSWQNRIPSELQCNNQISRLMQTASNGGVFLLNIGPTGNGDVIDYEKEVLHKMGKWVNSNKEAIYNTEMSPFDMLENVCCTKKDNKLYITILDPSIDTYIPNLNTEILKSYYLSSPNEKVNLNIKDGAIEIKGKNVKKYALSADLLARPEVIVLELADKDVKIEHNYIKQEENGNITLTGNDAVTHPALDAEGYITTQSNSYKTWYIDVNQSGTFDIFAIYLPEEDAKRYTLSCNGESVSHTFPGVDRMIQTAYVGKMHIEKGKHTFSFSQAEKCSPLEPLGIEIEKLFMQVAE